jgi:hypothetical protein
MAFTRGANVVTNGLVLSLDAANRKSYISGSSSWRDMAGSGYLGTLISNPSSSLDNCGSIVFNGTTNYVNSPSYPVTAPFSFYTGSFTLEATFKPIAYQTSSYFGLTNMVLLKGPASTFNYVMQVTSDTSVSFIKRGSAESLQYNTFTVPSMLNKINNTVFTINATGTTVTCYLNGNLIGSLAITGTPIEPNTPNDFLLIGALGGTAATYFTGNIYNIRIYNKTLNAEEVQQNYNALKPRFNL